MNDMIHRLWLMLLGWGPIGVVYTISGIYGAEGTYLLKPTAIDRWFDFYPGAIWIYLSFFLIVPLGYLRASPERARWLAGEMALSALGAAAVFALFPTTMHFPDIPQNGLSADVLRLLAEHDTVRNCLPSLHVTLTVLAVCALWRRGAWLANGLMTGWGAAICLSILQLQRHRFVDLLAGLALALAARWIAYKWPYPVAAVTEAA